MNEEVAAMMLAALHEARRALAGQYPWPIAGKFTQKEARTAALITVETAIVAALAEQAATEALCALRS